ncbi:hypothetical protein GCM10007382_17250 [Salinibacterium xinjiangense]|nr:hypothetical protein GCM10007382_17250 [Salinibacterium xinjiangense]
MKAPGFAATGPGCSIEGASRFIKAHSLQATLHQITLHQVTLHRATALLSCFAGAAKQDDWLHHPLGSSVISEGDPPIVGITFTRARMRVWGRAGKLGLLDGPQPERAQRREN